MKSISLRPGSNRSSVDEPKTEKPVNVVFSADFYDGREVLFNMGLHRSSSFYSYCFVRAMIT
jgi:hypothetical protein